MPPPPAEHLAARVFLGPALRAQPDRRLVDLVRNGYDAAFEEIVRRYRRPLDRFAAAMVGSRSEDVTQDAFSKALLALRGSEAEIELRPWLYRIVRNTALNDLRDRAPVAEELVDTLPGGLSAAAEAETREELRDLMARLQALPEPQRAALVMRELEGLSHEEIATALGLSGGAARQAIFRARSALRDGLGLLLPMPALRALAEHADEAAGAGAAIAVGAGASSAGGAALGGLGGGALKVGMATVLIAGTVGAGVAIEHREGGRPGPEAAEAAPLSRGAAEKEAATPERQGSEGPGGPGRSGDDDHDGDRRNHGEGGDDGSSDGDGDRSGHGGGEGRSGDRSGLSGDDRSGHGDSGSGSIDNSGPGSHRSGSGEEDDHSGTSGGSGDGGFESDGGSSSGPGSGEGGVIDEPVPTTEPVVEGGSGSSGSGGESSGSGEDSGRGETGELDG